MTETPDIVTSMDRLVALTQALGCAPISSMSARMVEMENIRSNIASNLSLFDRSLIKERPDMAASLDPLLDSWDEFEQSVSSFSRRNTSSISQAYADAEIAAKKMKAAISGFILALQRPVAESDADPSI